MKKFDIAVIGSGAGLLVTEAALGAGMTCAIVERSKFGGTCLNRGCIPSKILVYPADIIREAQHAKRVGVDVPVVNADWDRISERMWRQIKYSEQIETRLTETETLTVFRGTGEFTGPKTMSVTDYDGNTEEFEADRFVIAAGAHSFVPPIEGLEEAGYVISETFFGGKFPQKPWKSLIIIGGGPIGAEFAHIFSAMGTKVTILQGGERILNTEEEEISLFVRHQFEQNGIDVFTNAQVLSAGSKDGRKTVSFKDKTTNELLSVSGEEILVSAGVRSNGTALKLERANVETDAKGWIITNEYLETSRKNIWAIGDINGKYQFRHKANYEAEILTHNLLKSPDNRKRACYNAVPWAIFTHPQVAHVGITEREAKAAGIACHVAKNHYSDVIGGIKMGYSKRYDDDGFVKMIVGDDKKILGVHIVGPDAAILLQPFVYLMNAGLICPGQIRKSSVRTEIDELRVMCPPLGTYAPILNSMVIHPSLSELTAWAFENIDWN
ncbi:MAG: NAD(P)/FAD-dependent oxidoreductase [Oscillospiraceae bacterium]